MQRKWIIILAALLSTMSFADTCPSVDDIKNEKVIGWKAFDSDDGTPLPLAREKEYKKNIEQFALAEWVNSGEKTGAIHCYYRDNAGSDLEAYYAKEHFTPKIAKSYWYEVSGYMQCAAGMAACEFEENKVHMSQLKHNPGEA